MNLTSQQKSFLRSLGHHLNPVVWIGQHGMTENIAAEILRALTDHELIKVRIHDDENRDKIVQELCRQSQAELVQTIGKMILLYKRNPEDPKIQFKKH